MAEWLVARGHDVCVVTALPYYPGWKIDPRFSVGYTEACKLSSRPGLVVLRSWLWVPRSPSGGKRILHLLSFALSSLPLLVWQLARKPDLAFVVVPTLAIAPQSALLGRLFRVRTWLHVHDFELDAALRLGVLRLHAGQSLLFAIERLILRAFSRVSTISAGMLARLHAKGVRPTHSRLLPNWVDIAAITPVIGNNAVRTELGLGADDVLVLYAGNMGEKQGLEIVVDAARRLCSMQGIRFLMVGEGSSRAALKVSAEGLPNMTWWPLQPKAGLSMLLHAADIHVLPQRADAADLVMPSKLGPMLASAKVVVGTAEAGTELGRLLDDVGVRVASGDIDGLVGALKRCAADPALRLSRGERGRALVARTLDREAVLGAFEAQCEALISEKSFA